jgi:hypothetical protein
MRRPINALQKNRENQANGLLKMKIIQLHQAVAEGQFGCAVASVR